MYDAIKEALSRHMAKLKGHHPLHDGDAMVHTDELHSENERENGDKAPDLADHEPNVHALAKGADKDDGPGLEEALEADGDPNHHPAGDSPARSGGGLSVEEHQKILHALSGSSSPIGRKAMTLGERASSKIKEKMASIEKHKKDGAKSAY